MINSGMVQRTATPADSEVRRMGWLVALILLTTGVFLSGTYILLTVYANGLH